MAIVHQRLLLVFTRARAVHCATSTALHCPTSTKIAQEAVERAELERKYHNWPRSKHEELRDRTD